MTNLKEPTMNHSAVVLATLMSVLGVAACNKPTDVPAPKPQVTAASAPFPISETRPASAPSN